MNKDAVIAVLRAHEAELKELGILHAGVFGSVARGEARPDSDIDIAIDIDMRRHPTLFDYVGMQRFVRTLFDEPVDVIDREGVRPDVRQNIQADLIDAF